MALLSFASIALTENKPYLLVTVLIYNDAKGHQVGCRGRIPKQIITAIRKDIKSRLGATSAKVVPLFGHYSRVPAVSELTRYVKQRFDHVYLTEIPESLASKEVQMKGKNIKQIITDKLEDLAKVMRENEEAVDENSIVQKKLNKAGNLSINNIAPLRKTYYYPNTVFYAVEIKCKTPTDESCNLKKSHHHEPPRKKSFKKLFFKKTALW